MFCGVIILDRLTLICLYYFFAKYIFKIDLKTDDGEKEKNKIGKKYTNKSIIFRLQINKNDDFLSIFESNFKYIL